MDSYNHKYLKYKYKYHTLKKYFQNRIAGVIDIPASKVNYPINMLCMKLFDNLEGASNIISPLAIIFILSLLQLASQDKTESELSELLEHKFSIEELDYLYQTFNGENITMSNIFLINKRKINKINNDYFDKINSVADVIVTKLDQPKKIIKKINSYIEKNTGGIINNIVSARQINESLVMVLINSTYFNSRWLYKFNKNNTVSMPFHKTNYIEMMHQINTFNYYENEKLQFIEMQYEQKDYVMGIIIPIFRDDNNLFQSTFNVPDLNIFDINVLVNKLEPTLIDLYVPKFVHKKNIDLVPILRKMGIKELFNKRLANLNTIAKDLYVSQIIHATAVAVDEEGIYENEFNNLEPRGSEQLSLNKMNNQSPNKTNNTKVFKVDHAFLYYIRYTPANIIILYGDYQGN